MSQLVFSADDKVANISLDLHTFTAQNLPKYHFQSSLDYTLDYSCVLCHLLKQNLWYFVIFGQESSGCILYILSTSWRVFQSHHLRPKNKSPQIRTSAFLIFFFCCCYETMSNWSQNCWIDWNSVVLCFKRLFHIGVWTFAWFVRPLLATILYNGKFGPRAYSVSHISLHRFLSRPMTRNLRLFYLALGFGGKTYLFAKSKTVTPFIK